MTVAQPLRVVLADDEALARRRLARMLREAECEVLAELPDAASVLGWFREHEPPDVLFLDIQMPGLTGLELAAELENPPPVVFVTAHAQYAIQAFTAAAADYLLKPVEEARLRKTLERLQQRTVMPRGALELGRLIQRSNRRVAVKAGEGTIFLDLRKITHFEVEHEVVHAWAGERFRTAWTTLAEVEKVFPDAGLVRIQRHLLVRAECVLGLRNTWNGRAMVRLPGGLELEASRNSVPQLKNILGV